MIFVWIILTVACVALDQITKILVSGNMTLGEEIDLIPGVFRFKYITNDGAAFGMLDNARWVFLVFSTAAIIAMIAFFIIKKPKDKLLCSSLCLIVGGGIGNMIDRIAYGEVVDFIDFYAFPKIWSYIFNVADICVCVGAGMLILWLVLDMIRDTKKQKSEEESEVKVEGEAENGVLNGDSDIVADEKEAEETEEKEIQKSEETQEEEKDA